MTRRYERKLRRRTELPTRDPAPMYVEPFALVVAVAMAVVLATLWGA